MEAVDVDVPTSQPMDISMTASPKVEVQVFSSAVSDSAIRQPYWKVQKIELNGAEGKAGEIPSASDANDLTAQTNGCCDNSLIANVSGVTRRDDQVLGTAALRVKRLSEHAVLPARGSKQSAGYDLASAYDCVVPARGKCLVKTDLSIAIPLGTYARIAPRSGLALKKSIHVGGVVDFDYRGPVGVILFNHSNEDLTIKAGDRVAQLILERIVTPEVMEVDNLDATERGAGGFGSTGLATPS